MECRVAIGVDTHRDEHVAVALDELGGVLGSLAVRADAAGYARLWEWAAGFRREPLVAVEGTGSYGAGLTAFLVAAGVEVFECERPRRRDRRQGKSDLIDAKAAAKRLLSGERLPRPRGGGVRDDLRLLLMERQGAVRARTAALNGLQAALVTGPETLRSRFRGLDGKQAAKLALKMRPASGETAVAAAVVRRIAVRVRQLSCEIDDIDAQLQTITGDLVPELLAECGVGPVCAAQLVVSSGDPGRMHSEASFAALAGTSPVEASSGQTRRHRLNRGGDRQLNRAFHTIALNRTRRHPPTAAYYQRLLDEGKTPREARRCVKRQLARYFHQRLKTSPGLALTP